MGIWVHQDIARQSELQDRIDAELREKAQSAYLQDDPDLDEDSEYTKHLKKTGRFGWFWFILVFLAVASVVVILII